MTATLRLTWSGPFTLVNARRRLHWSARHAEDQALRRWAYYAALDEGIIFSRPVEIEAMTTQAKGVLPDCDAITSCMKPVIDGLADADVFLDDSGQHVRSIRYHAPERTDERSLIVIVKEAA